MKKTFLVVLLLMMALIIKAGDVTPEQALQQAKDFLQQRAAAGVNAKRSQALASELKMAGRVSGLYVFNSDSDNGFVIVSNDDRTEAVLGYSYSGQLDLDDMPENMRAWLQGYADEIAWLEAHDYQPSTNAAPRRSAPVKSAIGPLMQTRWDQDGPYNKQCPYYQEIGCDSYLYSTVGGNHWEHCATGCVCTAMAQAMYYNQWPVAETQPIPEYTWEDADITMEELPATTFDWANMQLTYTGSETDEQKTAVATLMQYCGCSLMMNYGPSSGALTYNIATMLQTYFDYDATAKYISRNNYSYANWIEILYHELSESRIMVYRGQSSDGGHSFICDGYEGGDYFHINWGWGGISDGYYKLTVLNPYEQGIGGSSVEDGFWIGESAIVGIQPKGAGGTVLDLPLGNFNLSVVDGRISSERIQYKEMKLMPILHNAGSDPYDGEIELEIFYEDSDTPEKVDFQHFSIPAGGDAAEVFTFVPKKHGSYKAYFFENYGVYRYLATWNFTVEEGSGIDTSTLPVSSNLNLTVTLKAIENANADLTEVYGKNIKAAITVSNPSTTTNFKGKFRYYLRKAGNPSWNYMNNLTIEIPAGDSYDIEINQQDNDQNIQYYFSTCYVRTGSNFTEETQVGDSFWLRPAIYTYDAAGTVTVSKETDRFVAPAEALAVDMSETTVTAVTPNGKPNCIYIYGDSKPAGLDGKNTVAYDGSAYTAEDITLTDGNDFYSPVDFTASNIEFTYDNNRWAGDTNGWNTIMLPFDVTAVKADDTTIDWFHSDSDIGKQFWLKEFVSDAVGTVNFDYVSGPMQAHTPYIIALPGNRWGAESDLSGKTIKFIGTNAEVRKNVPVMQSAGSYTFVGNTRAVDKENIYCISDDGNRFVLKPTGGSAPFRPFFRANVYDDSIEYLSIGGNIVTGVKEVKEVKGVKANSFYTLDGRRLNGLPTTKGIYIMNGQKIVIR